MYEKERQEMVEGQIKARGISDKKVLDAMLKVPRHEFVPESARKDAYSDFPLPIGEGQTISQPYIVALMTELLELKETDKVLEIGTGSGYQAAIIAEIAKEIVTIERIGELSESARRNLSKYDNIKIVFGNGVRGYPERAPYDGIIVTAAAKNVPEELVKQLAEGGRLVIPVQYFYYQRLMRYRKVKGKIAEEYITDVMFVPLIDD